MEISFLSYAVKSKRYSGSQFMKQKIWRIFFFILYFNDIGRGEEVYLDIYCAGSGPAVGGMQDEKSRRAAKALVDYVWQAEPVNYAYKAYYLDGPTTLEFGIRDGAPYYNETELRLSEKEFRELYARLST